MTEFIDKLFSLGYWDVISDLHGFFSMLALIFFGAAIVLLLSLNKFDDAMKWLKTSVIGLFTTVALLESSGLFIYRAYRTKAVPSPRTFLKSSPDTKWLHSYVFEHKEHLAYAPLLIIITALVLLYTQGDTLKKKPKIRRVLIMSLVAALVYLLVVAAEAVLVTKAAPLG